jgi:hypothetical protein
LKDVIFGESAGTTGAELKPHRGLIVLTLGILSIFLVGAGWVLGPIAWILGSRDLKAMRNGEMDPGGEGWTHAGWLCGMVMTIIHIVGIVAMLAVCLVWAAIVAGHMTH